MLSIDCLRTPAGTRPFSPRSFLGLFSSSFSLFSLFFHSRAPLSQLHIHMFPPGAHCLKFCNSWSFVVFDVDVYIAARSNPSSLLFNSHSHLLYAARPRPPSPPCQHPTCKFRPHQTRHTYTPTFTHLIHRTPPDPPVTPRRPPAPTPQCPPPGPNCRNTPARPAPPSGAAAWARGRWRRARRRPRQTGR